MISPSKEKGIYHDERSNRRTIIPTTYQTPFAPTAQLRNPNSILPEDETLVPQEARMGNSSSTLDTCSAGGKTPNCITLPSAGNFTTDPDIAGVGVWPLDTPELRSSAARLTISRLH